MTNIATQETDYSVFGLGRQYAFKISDFILHIAQIQTLM